MGMTGFSDAEMALLSGLDAVAWVTRTRITYTDSFKREAVTRYRRGGKPPRDFPLIGGAKAPSGSSARRGWTRASSATNASNGASPGGSANRRTPGRRARMPRRATPAGREDPRR